MQKLIGRIVLFTLLLLVLTGCLAGPESVYASSPGNFWAGAWHGLLAPFTLIASFLTDNITMYEPQNVGSEYDLGFLMGFTTLVVLPNILRYIKRRR